MHALLPWLKNAPGRSPGASRLNSHGGLGRNLSAFWGLPVGRRRTNDLEIKPSNYNQLSDWPYDPQDKLSSNAEIIGQSLREDVYRGHGAETQEAYMTNPDFAALVPWRPQFSSIREKAKSRSVWIGTAFALYGLVLAAQNDAQDYRVAFACLIFDLAVAAGVVLGLRFFACFAVLCCVVRIGTEFIQFDSFREPIWMLALHSFGLLVAARGVQTSFRLKLFGAIVEKSSRRRARIWFATLAFFMVTSFVSAGWFATNP
jgi:hypothetical protein